MDNIEFRLAKAGYFQRMVWPHFESSFRYLEHAVAYGRLALTYLVALNSGGLVALPAYFEIFGSPNGTYLILIGASFGVGISTAMGAIFLAYLNFSLHTRNAHYDFAVFREYADIEMPYPGASNEDIDQHFSRAAELVQEKDKHSLFMKITVFGPMILGGLSAIGFILGACLMAFTFVRVAGS